MPIKIHRRMKAAYGDGCMDVKNVRKWVRHAENCCAGEMSVLDEHRPGWSISVLRTSAEWMPWSRKIAKLRTETLLGISQERVHHIIEMLNYREVCTRWVPRQLTDPMKEHRKTVAPELLNQYRLKGYDFLNNIAAGDKSWVHHHDPENEGNPWNIIIQVLRV